LAWLSLATGELEAWGGGGPQGGGQGGGMGPTAPPEALGHHLTSPGFISFPEFWV